MRPNLVEFGLIDKRERSVINFAWIRSFQQRGGTMLVNSGKAVTMRFKRSGGSIIQARIDVWKATPTGWQSAAVFDFEEAKKPEESDTQNLDAGEYTCICRCYVRESVNGVYHYELTAGDGKPCAGDGDVNTTSADGDSQIFRCPFVLKVSP